MSRIHSGPARVSGNMPTAEVLFLIAAVVLWIGLLTTVAPEA